MRARQGSCRLPRFGFAIDNRACIGCHACTVACKSEHDVPIGVNRTWVKYIEKGTFPNARRSFNVQRCNHCADAPCVEICPVTSLYTRPDGIVDFDSDRCIGCKACMQACPYDALYLDPNTNTAAKCNYCTHRVDQGYEPACVVVCPVEAIVSGDLDDPNGRLAILDRTQRVQYPKVEKATRPKLFYVGGETAALDPTEAVPQADYLWSGTGYGINRKTLAKAEEESEGEARARRVYDVNAKPAPWGWMVSAYVTTKAISAGTMLVAFRLFMLSQTTHALPAAAALISIAALAVTGVLLVGDLKQPKRFLYVLLRPQWKSWLVRGAYIISAYGLMLVTLTILSALRAPPAAQTIVGLVTGLLAIATAAYTAFLFAQAKGRDYWQNPMLAVTMVVDAVVAGVAIMILIGGTDWTGGLVGQQANQWMMMGVLVLAALLIAERFTKHPSGGAEIAATSIYRGRFAIAFWTSVFVGIVVPLVTGFVTDYRWIGAVGILLGITIKNHILVQAPQRVPLS